MINAPVAIGRIDNTRPSYEKVADLTFRKINELKTAVAVKCTPNGMVYLEDASKTSVPQLLVVVIDPNGQVRYREHHLELDLMRHARQHDIVPEMRTRRVQK